VPASPACYLCRGSWGYHAAVRFDWDPLKAERNLAKHGVSFDEAATVLVDTLGWTYPDEKHSTSEQRWVTIGMSENQRLLVVAHAGDETYCRIISGRPASRKERKFYEES
jgi:uncharacterized protein